MLSNRKIMRRIEEWIGTKSFEPNPQKIKIILYVKLNVPNRNIWGGVCY